MEKQMAGTTRYRIAITGPESTGKSELARRLAEHFNEPWVPEYSREYLSQLKTEYSFNDILAIARGQYERELSLLPQAKQFLFCDTDFLVTHIWSKVRFGKTHPWIEGMILQHPYDFTLLCYPDIPWESDPLRENPNDRELLYSLYLEELEKRNIRYGIVKGVGDERVVRAIEHLTPALLKAKG